VGAPAEVVARLSAARQEYEARQRSSVTSRETSKDPELDQFMVINSATLPHNLMILIKLSILEKKQASLLS
jgi:hypothetical protein